MKRSNNSSSKISIQVDIDENLTIDKNAFLSQKKVYSLEDFMNLFRKQMARDVLQTFQKELTEEIDQRTSVVREMIPDDIWKFVFQLFAHQKDISKVFILKEVCKKWDSFFSIAIEEATIEKQISLERLHLKSLRSLFITNNIEITNEIFTNLFMNLKSLNISPLISVKFHGFPSSEMLSKMTNLTSLSSARYHDDHFVNNDSLSCLVNLKYLALGSTSCNHSSLKKLVHLKELDFKNVTYLRLDLESKLGPNLNIIDDLKNLKVITFYRPSPFPHPIHLKDYFNINALQKQYSHVQFRWYIGYKGTYEGSFCDDNFMSGKGKFVYENGDIYEGEFKKDLKEGKGTYQFSQDLSRYEGDWKNNVREGMGTFFWPFGSSKGDWKNNVRDGKGIYTWQDPTTRYEGGVKNGDVLNGVWNGGSCTGVMFYSNGCYLKGSFFDNGHLIECQGVLYFTNGNMYEGHFKNDERVGKGIFHYNNGEIIEGDESKFILNEKNGTIELL